MNLSVTDKKGKAKQQRKYIFRIKVFGISSAYFTERA